MTSPDSRVELRHLRVLRAILAESSVSRAAEALGQSQPAISATLRQLRELFGDPLLVRSGAGMVPTERAVAIAEAAGRVLDEIDEMLAPTGVFEPATSTRNVRIVAYSGLCSLLVPSIVAALRAQAPNLKLEFAQPLAPEVTRQQLHDGEVDLVIGYRQGPFQSLRFAPLMECDIVCVVSASHEFAGKRELTLEEYLSLRHLSPSAASVVAGAPIDGQLLDLGLRRNVAVSLPEYALARQILLGSDLVFTTALPYARDMVDAHPLVMVGAPSELGRIGTFMFWHEKSHHSAFARWLRQNVKAAAGAAAISAS